MLFGMGNQMNKVTYPNNDCYKGFANTNPTRKSFPELKLTGYFILLVLLGPCVYGNPIKLDENLERNVSERQTWGYVKVRTGAHMFWWLYYTTAQRDYTQRPLVMWLQGGPGTSSTGFGNFYQIGPLHLNLTRRMSSWDQHVNLLLVDTPVGTGFSYVESPSLLNQNNAEIVQDLMQMFQTFLQNHPEFQTVPFYIFSESYGGKLAVELALQLNKTTQTKRIKCDLKGVSLGSPWISPLDSVLSWGPYLYSTSLIDKNGLAEINRYANAAKKALDLGLGNISFTIWDRTQGSIRKETNGVDFYNILKPFIPPEIQNLGVNRTLISVAEIQSKIPQGIIQNLNLMKYDLEVDLGEIIEILNERVLTQESNSTEFNTVIRRLTILMNGRIREKLKIIPKNVTWGGQSTLVFQTMGEDFMKPVVNIVEELLNDTPIQVYVSTAQLDLVVDTLGTMKWVNNLNWKDLQNWKMAPRKPFMVNGTTEMYLKSYKNFGLFWILKSGHMVPTDVPITAVKMLKCITKLNDCFGK